MKALVTGMMTPYGLFTVRRLAEMGFDVTAAACSGWDYAMYSKGVKKRLKLPSTRYEPIRFAEAVINELRTGNYDIYVPTFEDGFVMSYFRDEIAKYTKTLLMPFKDIMTAHDKGTMRDVAKSIGVGVPDPTYVPKNMDEALEILAGIDYPVVLKQRRSCGAHGQQIVKDPQKLVSLYRGIVEEYHLTDQELPLIQRFIGGPQICTVGLAYEGELLGQVAFRSLRTQPRDGGTTALKEIVDSPLAFRNDAALVKKLNWTGFFCSDYLTDDTGNLNFIDCNPRMAPGIILGYNGGVDLLSAYVDLALGKKVGPLAHPKAGTLGRMQFLDLGWLIDSLMDKSYSFSQKVDAWKEWRDHRGQKIKDDVFSWSDIKPGLMLYWFIITRLGPLLSPHQGEVFLENHLFDEARFYEQLAAMPVKEAATASV